MGGASQIKFFSVLPVSPAAPSRCLSRPFLMNDTFVWALGGLCVATLFVLMGVGLDLHYRLLPSRAKARAAGKTRIDKLC